MQTIRDYLAENKLPLDENVEELRRKIFGDTTVAEAVHAVKACPDAELRNLCEEAQRLPMFEFIRKHRDSLSLARAILAENFTEH